MCDEHSITQWIADLKIGEDPTAQRELWQRYFQRLMGLARFKLGTSPRRALDEEDVAVSALHSFFSRVGQGAFPALRDRTNLWPLLAKITARKAINVRKGELRQKRGGGHVRGESVFVNAENVSAMGLENVVLADDLTPAHLAIMDEQCRRLMEMLPEETLRRIAERKLEGYQNSEIAAQLHVTERTIERKLQRIRNLWAAAID